CRQMPRYSEAGGAPHDPYARPPDSQMTPALHEQQHNEHGLGCALLRVPRVIRCVIQNEYRGNPEPGPESPAPNDKDGNQKCRREEGTYEKSPEVPQPAPGGVPQPTDRVPALPMVQLIGIIRGEFRMIEVLDQNG